MNLSPFHYLKLREVDKVGSLLHLIAKKSGELYLTRLLKLLYLIDEKSVMEIGVPVTPFEYKVAENGPLIVDLWRNLKTSNYFNKYINVSVSSNEDGYKIVAVGEPNINRFSDYEIELINTVIREYKGYSTSKLIDFIHNKEKSLWNDIVFNNDLTFETNKISEHAIDFKQHIIENETLSHFYETYRITR